jgi:hypothetical protein
MKSRVPGGVWAITGAVLAVLGIATLDALNVRIAEAELGINWTSFGVFVGG